MRIAASIIGALVCVSAVVAAPAHAAAEWVSVAKTDRTEVFANPASLGVSPKSSWLIVRTRQNFAEPQPSAKKNKTFLSARNEYRVDCAQRRLAYSEMHAFAEVQKTRISEKNLKWMDAPSGTVFGEILDYACKNAPAAAPAS
jgi:hypothetical protein